MPGLPPIHIRINFRRILIFAGIIVLVLMIMDFNRRIEVLNSLDKQANLRRAQATQAVAAAEKETDTNLKKQRLDQARRPQVGNRFDLLGEEPPAEGQVVCHALPSSRRDPATSDY